MKLEHIEALEYSIETVADDSVTASSVTSGGVDEHGIIGKGTHLRVVINLDRFMKNLSERN
ncbi:MAG: hypothetical protein GQ565_10505 [Candidatus Aegiribacteria sp.]|nr:hypothetical protein [Candidatus Aegiribacteria sp.]